MLLQFFKLWVVVEWNNSDNNDGGDEMVATILENEMERTMTQSWKIDKLRMINHKE